MSKMDPLTKKLIGRAASSAELHGHQWLAAVLRALASAHARLA